MMFYGDFLAAKIEATKLRFQIWRQKFRQLHRQKQKKTLILSFLEDHPSYRIAKWKSICLAAKSPHCAVVSPSTYPRAHGMAQNRYP
jgi:hypothetical protein